MTIARYYLRLYFSILEVSDILLDKINISRNEVIARDCFPRALGTTVVARMSIVQ